MIYMLLDLWKLIVYQKHKNIYRDKLYIIINDIENLYTGKFYQKRNNMYYTHSI